MRAYGYGFHPLDSLVLECGEDGFWYLPDLGWNPYSAIGQLYDFEQVTVLQLPYF